MAAPAQFPGPAAGALTTTLACSKRGNGHGVDTVMSTNSIRKLFFSAPTRRLWHDDAMKPTRRWSDLSPRTRRLIFVEELPRNPSGKVLKRELKEQLNAGRFTA